MMIARWHIDARFGHKQAVIDAMNKWAKEIAPQIGWSADKLRMCTGSIGARESTVESEVVIQDLKELDTAWSKLATIEAHKRWSKDLEPYVVSGTPRWEVFRVL
ncbi:MAG TPA: hypothetical protein VFR86_08330 [Burkholderiaceae bacterium]|nr:hypothetical protein [Burkholderiaceae bacterium]